MVRTWIGMNAGRPLNERPETSILRRGGKDGDALVRAKLLAIRTVRPSLWCAEYRTDNTRTIIAHTHFTVLSFLVYLSKTLPNQTNLLQP